MKKDKTKKKKEPKRKPKYGMLSCIGYMLKLMWGADKSIAFSAVATVPVRLILSAIGLYMPTVILRELEVSSDFAWIVAVICGFVMAQMIFSLVQHAVKKNIDISEHLILLRKVSASLAIAADFLRRFFLPPSCSKKQWGQRCVAR